MGNNKQLLNYLRKTFISYFFAVAIPISILSIVYISSIYPMMREDQYNIYVNTAQSDTKKISSLADNIYSYLFLLDSMQNIWELQNYSYDKSVYAYVQTIDSLKAFKVNNESISKAAIYVENSQKVLISDGYIYNASEFDGIKYINALVQSQENNRYYDQGDEIVYAATLPNYYFDDSVIVLFYIDVNVLYENTLLDNFIIFDRNGNGLFNNSKVMKEDFPDIFETNENTTVQIINDKDRIITYIYEPKSDLFIVRTYEMDVIKGIIRNSIYFTIAILISVLIVSSILSYWLAKKQVKPLERLSSQFIKLDKVETQLGQTIFDTISLSLQTLQTENEAYIHRYEENKNILKEQVMRDLLWGHASDSGDINQCFERINIQPKYSNFVVILVKTGENIPSGTDIKISEVNIIVKSMIEQQLINRFHVIGSTFIRLDHIVFFLNVENDQFNKNEEDRIKMILGEVDHDIFSSISVHIRSIISYPVSQTEELCKVFANLIRTMERTNIKDSKTIFLTKRNNDEDIYPNYLQSNLLKNIMNGDINNVNNILKDVFHLKHKVYVDDKSENLVRLIIGNVMNQLMDSSNIVTDEDIHVIDILYESISYQEKQEKITTRFIDITKRYKKHILLKDNNAHVYNAIEFINQNYTRDISISEVSDYIGINSAYFSRIFKGDMGMTPLQYITMVRINKSKDLLLQANGTVKEISREVGYQDSRSFIRYFKKMEGCTPGEYKSLLK